MTNEEALDELNVIYERLSHPEDCEQGVYSFRDGDYLEALDMAIKALEEISRLPENLHREREQAYMNGYVDAKSTFKKSAYDDAVERIEKSTFTLHDGLDCVETLVALNAVMIASAQPRPMGKWMFVHPLQEDDGGAYMCSLCKSGHWDISADFKFCPYCGARMAESEG